MPSTEQLRSRLLKKLTELFQLDQPDLDFGFYRIMHAKARQVQDFIDKDLLKIVTEAFGQVDETHKTELRTNIEKEISAAREYGVSDPENSPKVKEARAEYNAFKNTISAESDVYDHLYRFFERYYDSGDFMSLRYYTAETSGKAAPYAIPYNGEEVKLHWANADQYYIKTAEYFSNFTFDLLQAKEIKQSRGRMLENLDDEEITRKVHFRIADAAEGEHGNIKAAEAGKRFFIIHQTMPVELTEEGRLVVNFEYRPDPEKTGQDSSWQKKRNAEAVAMLLHKLEEMAISNKEPGEYLRLLKTPAPIEKDKKRPLLAKYVHQYTTRNTSDYFIHKDLGSFLRRELDFYIKNEVMRLDDIENADVPAVETYLAKIKVLRKIAGKLIDFLAQLEDFQKKLWLKKKFVVETDYCITLDRVPEEFYPEIAANHAQHDEWVKLFAIDEIEDDLLTPAYSNPLSVEFLKANDKLVLDTRFFGDLPAEASAQAGEFKARLIASLDNFDEQCDGLLIHSENFQALNLLQEQYCKKVNCIHIDPPYNTATSGFLYKNEYQHSSWLTMMFNGISSASQLLLEVGAFQCHIDENEYEVLYQLFNSLGLPDAGTIVWDKKNPMLGRKGVATQHEYVIWRGWNDGPIYLKNSAVRMILSKSKEIIAKYESINEALRKEFAQWISKCPDLTGGERAYRLIDDEGQVFQSVAMGAPEPRTNPKFHIPLIHPVTKKPCPVPSNGWSRTPETIQKLIKKEEIIFGKDEKAQPRKKIFLTNTYKRQISSVITEAKRGKQDALALGIEFPYSHPAALYETLLGAGTNENGVILDYFAGSGTTAHAVINLNREDGGKRKYILVEMGDYFDTVLKPRIAKVVYSESWKNGKPASRQTGISHCFKYLRLESYEDTLNNLRFDDNEARDNAIAANASLKEDYMLHYLLKVETRDSQSLLNIDAFADPCSYKLKVKKPGSDEYVVKNVDLIETFNYLIGLRVIQIAAPQTFTANFKRVEDQEVPQGQKTKLVLDGRLRQINHETHELPEKEQQKNFCGPDTWWFRKIEGWVPENPTRPDNNQRERVLVVWRKLTGDPEKDNLMLDEWFQRLRISSSRDFKFDTIYVNGSNNLPDLKLNKENWKVRLIEEEFMKRMWDVEDI